MIPRNSATLYGMQNEAEKWLWIIYLMIVILSSLFGDIIILIASFGYNAFKLNKFIVALIQQIAVCDLALTLAWAFPIVISIIAEDWILSDVVAKCQIFMTSVTYLMSNLLVCFLTFSKYLLVRYPLKTRGWTAKGAHLFCGVFWFVIISISLGTLIAYSDDLEFDYSTYEIKYNVINSGDGIASFSLVLGSFYIVTMVIVILTAVLTLRLLFKARAISRRGNGSVRWQGILTVVLTAAVYCVSSLLFNVNKVTEMFKKEQSPGLVRLASYLTLLNVMSNFYIYSLTVPSFRRFLRSKILSLSSKLFSSLGGGGNDAAEERDNQPHPIAAEEAL